MTPDQIYAFDCTGYLRIEGVVPDALLAEVDQAVARLQEREGVWPLAEPVAPGARGNAAKVINAVLEDEVFLRVAMSPVVVSCMPQLVQHPRLKSTWVQLNSYRQGIGHHANHTPHDPADMYYVQGRICASLVTVMYAFCDIDEDGGALEVIPGSHKSNFPLPGDPAMLASLRRRLTLRRGDALIFTHDMNHGSFNCRNYVRRSLFTSYSPGTSAHTLGDNDLYQPLFERSVPGSWQRYLLRRPRGDRDTEPMPAHRVEEDRHLGTLLDVATVGDLVVPVVL